MTVQMDLINGIAVGIEFVPAIDEEEIPATIIVDVFILRFLLQW